MKLVRGRIDCQARVRSRGPIECVVDVDGGAELRR